MRLCGVFLGVFLVAHLHQVFCSLCVDGICQLCLEDEMAADYCSETGRKMSITCGKKVTWRGCEKTLHDEQVHVLVFQAVMAILGGVAYWGVQVKKAKNLSLFDTRKKVGRSSWYLAN